MRARNSCDKIKDAMNGFEKEIQSKRKGYQKKDIVANLTTMQAALCKKLKKGSEYKVVLADKNCGAGIIETEYYTEKGVTEHLNNAEVYQKMYKGVAFAHLKGVEMLIDSFINKFQDSMSDAEYIYLKRALKKYSGKMFWFYMTVKVHKNPIKYRPIVATCGTALSGLSKWLDYKLKQLLTHISTYIKDSNELREKLK